MSELNREQLIKAWECCKNNDGNCPTSCPLFMDVECTRTLGLYGLSLCVENEQLKRNLTECENGYAATLSLERAKIKELTEENERYKDLLCKANAKIYELQREIEGGKK